MQPTWWFVKSKRAQSDSDFETWRGGGLVPTLNAFDVGDTRATVLMLFPIQDGREVDKKQNGLGVGNDGDLAYTIDTVSHQAVVMRDREGKAGGGKGPLVSDRAFTLATSNFHTVFPSPMQVRRLTPTECERLQGFPDGWTEGQADSNRYKQMGNAVAVPVVEWIIGRLVEANANL